jgi:hypothetical protein
VSVRNGGASLVGLLRCGHCGRKLKVQHNGGVGIARYVCNDAALNYGCRTKCISFGNMRIDAAVSAEVLSLICPLGLEAALQAITDRERDGTQRLRQIELALEQARYKAARSHRQYDAVDPRTGLLPETLNDAGKTAECLKPRSSAGRACWSIGVIVNACVSACDQ